MERRVVDAHAPAVTRYATGPLDSDGWTDHDLTAFRALGFEPLGRVEAGAHTVAVLSRAEPSTLALLYEGTPYIELHSVFGRGFALVTTDTPLRVDEFGEHEGERARKTHLAQHRFLPLDGLMRAHQARVDEVSAQRGPARPLDALDAAVARLRALEGRRSFDDYKGLALLAAVFVGTIVLAVGALAYFAD